MWPQGSRLCASQSPQGLWVCHDSITQLTSHTTAVPSAPQPRTHVLILRPWQAPGRCFSHVLPGLPSALAPPAAPVRICQTGMLIDSSGYSQGPLAPEITSLPGPDPLGVPVCHLWNEPTFPSRPGPTHLLTSVPAPRNICLGAFAQLSPSPRSKFRMLLPRPSQPAEVASEASVSLSSRVAPASPVPAPGLSFLV